MRSARSSSLWIIPTQFFCTIRRGATSFAADQHLFNSGCIRVEHPLDLANSLLDPATWTRARIEQTIRAGKTRTAPINPPLPVAICHFTASVGTSGVLRFARDVYDYDHELHTALKAPVKRAVWWPAAR